MSLSKSDIEEIRKFLLVHHAKEMQFNVDSIESLCDMAKESLEKDEKISKYQGICIDHLRLKFVVNDLTAKLEGFKRIYTIQSAAIENHLAKLEIAKDAFDSEELEGEMGANDFQKGLYNEGATAILKRWIESNKEALFRITAKDSGSEALELIEEIDKNL
jgi:DNA-binding transcriptional MerR regulator